MKKNIFGLFLSLLLISLLATSALATPTYYDNNWYTTYGPKYLADADPFIATIDGNDNPNQDLGDLNQVITDWNNYFDGDPAADDDYVLPFLATATTDLEKAGNPISTTINVAGYKYLTVKYAGYVDLFNVEGLDAIEWQAMITGYNPAGKPMQNGISHYRLWNPTPSQTPVPAPILLLGTGLIGLVGFRRKLKT